MADRRERAVHLTAASTITVRPVRWLWQDRIALGTLALLGGREGVGKTICAYTIAADITKGRLAGVNIGTARAVIVAATEDSWEHTIVPRLMAAGADLDLVYRVDVETGGNADSPLSLPNDLDTLKTAVMEVGAALVILDPLMSRLDSGLDTHKDAEVRRALEPLVTLAHSTDACVLGLIHVSKSSSNDPLTLLMGSRAFAAVARAVLFVQPDADAEDQNTRMLGQVKNNLGRCDLPTLIFKIVGALVAETDEGPVWTGKLQWLGKTDRSIGDAIESAATSTGDRTAAGEAADWLSAFLTSHGGTAEAAAVKLEGGRVGHSPAALHRARKKLNVRFGTAGWPCHSVWTLAPQLLHGSGGSTTATTAMTATTTTTPLNTVVSVVSDVAVVQGPPARAKGVDDERFND